MPTNEASEDCIAARLRRWNRIVTNIYDEALRPFGLKISQMNVLSTAATMDAARPANLCRQLSLDPSTLSRNLQILRRQGWIEFLEDSGDARAQPFRVTPTGRDLLDRAQPAWRFAQQQAKQFLGPDAVKALTGEERPELTPASAERHPG